MHLNYLSSDPLAFLGEESEEERALHHEAEVRKNGTQIALAYLLAAGRPVIATDGERAAYCRIMRNDDPAASGPKLELEEIRPLEAEEGEAAIRLVAELSMPWGSQILPPGERVWVGELVRLWQPADVAEE